MLIGTYEFTNRPQDISLLEQISRVAAFAHTPFISAVSPEMFGFDSFTEMTDDHKTKIADVFDRAEYAGWHKFRKSETSHYVGLCLPHILLRDPYNLTGQFNFLESTFKENLSWNEKNDLLWGNAAFAFGACVARAYNEQSWLGKMPGIDDDGVIEGIYFQYFADENGTKGKHSLDVSIDRKIAANLSNSGLIPLSEDKEGAITYFSGSYSVVKPKEYDSETANYIAKSFAQLEYTIAASRFAVYLMCICRDRINHYTSRQEAEKFLNKWLFQLTLGGVVSDKLQPQYPLREARLNFKKISDQPGYYEAFVFILPTYQLEDMPIAMRVVIHLPDSAMEIQD
jgi:type VI secretion system protein ImpC